ncbi:MAG: HIT family protein [Odoribacteraceae bacterium]|jgi:histidine triad (HIT) family protein|nr:HIT family protein [Odoribacteraceae bacterium]
MASTIFTRIINGEIPSYKLAEDERHYAFLDISPLQRGHALVVPKREVDYLFDLEDEELAGLMTFARKVALAIEKSVPCRRVGVAVIGLEVPHAHVHLVPLHGLHDLDFSRPKLSIPADEMAALAATIRENL